MREFWKTLAYLSLVLATSVAVVLSLGACKTNRIVSDINTHVVTDTTTHDKETKADTATTSVKQDSIIHSLMERIWQYEHHSSRQDTLRNDSSVIVVDADGNVIRADYWHTQTIHDWQRDTVLQYVNRYDSTAIISRYADSLRILREELENYQHTTNDASVKDVVREKEPTFWDKAKMWWKETVIALVVILGMAWAVKRFLEKR